jgi:MFS family permease
MVFAVASHQGKSSTERITPMDALLGNIRWLKIFRILQSSYVYAPFFVFYLASLEFSPFEILLVTSLSAGTTAVLDVFTGYLADRYGRKLSLAFGAALAAIGYGMYGLASGFGLWVVLATIVASIGVSFATGADSALAYASLPEDSRQEAHRDFENWSHRYGALAEALASLIGAAQIALVFGLRGIMWDQAIIYTVMVPIALRLREPSTHERKSGASLQDLRQVLQGLRRNVHLRAVLFFTAVLANVTYLMVWLTPVYYTSVEVHGAHLSSSWFGVLWTAYLGSVWFFGRFFERFTKRWGTYGSLVILLGFGLGCYLVLGISASVWGLVAIFGLYFVRSMQVPLTTNLVARLSRRGEESTALSARRFGVWALYTPVAPLIGLVISRFGVSTGIMCAGLLWLVIGCWTLSVVWRTRPTHDN